jgi:hypothetical protein
MLVPLADAIDLPFPASVVANRKPRRSLKPSTFPQDSDVSVRNRDIDSEVKLEGLVRDEGIFEHALTCLDELLQDSQGILIEGPSAQEHLSERYYPVTVESDTAFNFGLAVVGRVTQALNKLVPGLFAVHAGVGQEDVTNLVYQCNRLDVLNVEYKTWCAIILTFQNPERC